MNSKSFKNMGSRFKEARTAWGFTQKQMAEYMDVSQSLIAKFEKGTRFIKFTSTDIDKLCNLFGCNEVWLVYGEGESGLDDIPNINICYVNDKK